MRGKAGSLQASAGIFILAAVMFLLFAQITCQSHNAAGAARLSADAF